MQAVLLPLVLLQCNTKHKSTRNDTEASVRSRTIMILAKRFAVWCLTSYQTKIPHTYFYGKEECQELSALSRVGADGREELQEWESCSKRTTSYVHRNYYQSGTKVQEFGAISTTMPSMTNLRLRASTLQAVELGSNESAGLKHHVQRAALLLLGK